MESGEITFDYPVDLPERLIDSSNNGPLCLLQLDDLAGPFSYIRVDAQVSEETGRRTLYLSSFLETDEPPLAQNDISKALEVTIVDKEGEEAHTKTDSPHSEAKIGMIVLRDDLYDDASTIVLPSLGGRCWSVTSQIVSIDDKHEDIETTIEVITDQHLLAVNALSSVLQAAHKLQASEDYQSAEPRTLMLSVPGTDLELHQTTDHLPVELNTDPFDNFVGIDSTVSKLRDFVRIANTPDEKLKANNVMPNKSVLLHGPSGTGKTELMGSLAEALAAEPIIVDFSDLSSEWTGKWATNIEKVFKDAYEKEGRVLIIFDEMDGLVSSGNQNSMSNITAVLKRQLEEIKKHPNVFFAGATNKLDAIDPDVRAKKRMLMLPIQHPNKAERIAIFERLLIGNRLASVDVDYEDLGALIEIQEGKDSLDLQKLADETDGLSAGDIVEIINDVHMRMFLDADDGSSAQIPALPSHDQILSAIRDAGR